jgi:hypothetical protein
MHANPPSIRKNTWRGGHHHPIYLQIKMKQFFQPNIGRVGRWVRGVGAVGMFIGAWFVFGVAIWAGILMATFGLFMLFEAWRGWCAVRACGIKTLL